MREPHDILRAVTGLVERLSVGFRRAAGGTTRISRQGRRRVPGSIPVADMNSRVGRRSFFAALSVLTLSAGSRGRGTQGRSLLNHKRAMFTRKV